VETLHQWFDYWLHGLRNGVMDEPRATIETAPGVFTKARDWPPPGTRKVNADLGAGVASYTDGSLTEDAAVAAPTTARPGRLAVLFGPTPARPSRSTWPPAG
jgi:X-Pro dipeptidyl-peptidase